ncbi:MAG: hypothetical protein JXR96_11970 [Deltaproteobacteria bacterium]|nr:hypothetical protein [Deltaproteobacteria bacterium]
MNDLSLEEWSSMSLSDCTRWAERLAARLPAGFAFRRIRTCSLGEREHRVAEFDWRDSCFMLVPGGEVELGLDPARPWEPTAEELASWKASAEEYGIELDIREHIARVTLGPRTAVLPALLMETTAGELGWRTLDSDDPRVRELLDERGDMRGQHVRIYRGGESLDIDYDDEGGVTVRTEEPITHEEVVARLASLGFRLPTGEEWEHACGAGARTLFRWGDHAPCDRYPTDISPEEAAWRRQWVLSGGKLERPPEGFESDWDLHRQPNAFGLFIASDPYKCELVAEPGTTRGGDGGGMICGGVGFFLGWLTLATSYFEEHACRREPGAPVLAGYTIARRVLPLG